MRTNTRIGILSAACLAAGAGACPVYEPVVIYTEIPGDPTADSGLGIDFTGFLSLNASPNGEHWTFKAFVDDPENDVIVVGFGLTGTVVAREAGPAPLPGTSHNFLDSDCGINDLGQHAYGSRLDGATTLTDEVVIMDDLAGPAVVVQESAPAPGLVDPDGGDEIYGNSLNSVHVLADGTTAYKADLIENINNDFESALYQGDDPVAQEGTGTTDGETIDSFIGLSGNTFSSSPDGSTWIVEGDIMPGLGTIEAVLVNNEVRLRDGDTLPGAPLAIDAVFGVDVDNDGNWFARGDFTDDTDWMVRNGAVIALTGTPITPGAVETWGDALSGMNGQGSDYLIAGVTSNPDPDRDSVIVHSNGRVVAREGDPIDLDGNGSFDDNVEIRTFSPEDLALTETGDVLAFITLRDSTTGDNLGDAFLRFFAAVGCNPADLAAPCGVLDLADINTFIAGFNANDPISDLAAPFGVWDLADLSAFISSFVNGCP